MSTKSKILLGVFAMIAFTAIFLSACSTPQASSSPSAAAQQPITVENNIDIVVDAGANGASGPAAEPVAIATAVVEINVPFAQAPTCPSWSQNEEKDLQSGESAMGDVQIFVKGKWIKVYDEGGVGEFTIVRNIGTTPIKIKAEWGAGCLTSIDQMVIIKGEFDNPNHQDLVRVRDIAIKSDEYTQTFWVRDANGEIVEKK